MSTDAQGKWLGLGVGDVDDPNTPRAADNWDAITLLTGKMQRTYQWARDLNIVQQPNYDQGVARAVGEFCTRTGLPVILDPNGQPVANLAMRTRLGSYPPPAPPTHAMFTVRGTGGIIGLDYTSQIAQALPGVYHEHPLNYDASMGGIPVGAATDPSAPSGDECSQQVYDMLTAAVQGSTVTFAVTGYSLGTKGVVMFLNDLFNPAHPLNAHAHRFVCAVLIADPWRPFGHTFYLGPIPGGQGIGSPYFTMTPQAITALGWRCCWLANPADMYTNSPLGATGQVLADIEQIVLATAASDPLGTIKSAIPYLLKLVEKDGGLQTMFGGSALGLLTGVAGGATALTGSLVGLLLPLLESGFEGLIDGISGNGSNLPPGAAADVQAAILALKFYGSGIAPHLAYHTTRWGSGPQTYLQLGIQHANDFGSQVPVTT